MTWVNNNLLPIFWVCLGSYLLGCVTAGYYLVRFVARRDIRAGGSGSVGARNVGRLLGAWGFATVLLCDFGKGALAVGLASRLTGDGRLALPALLAVTAGHVWPVQLKFHGGKGVSTSLGGLLIYDWRVALTFAAVSGLVVLLLRRFTLGGLIAFTLLPLLAMAWRENLASAFGLTILSALVLFTHRKNLAEQLFQPKPEGKS
jgi:acyl-phosphate glycerol 3-phosphate acyltransferase